MKNSFGRWAQTLFIFGVLCLPAIAAKQTFRFALGGVSVEVPKKWMAAPDLFGVPLVVLGPKYQGDRPGVYIIPLGKKGTVISEKQLPKSEQEYEKDVLGYLKGKNGELVRFHPQETTEWEHAKEVYVFGFEYRLKGEHFVERSHYAICGDRLYNLKSIYRKEHQERFSKDVEAVLTSFDCPT